MKYINISEFGGPEVLRLEERDTPTPGEGQVLVRVEAAGVNRPDCIQRAGFYPPPPGASDIPGLEIAGEVVELGANVSSPTIGNRVCALVTGGGYAEYCLAEAPLCLPVPDRLSPEEAAAIPETYFTVWSNVFDRGHLLKGESLLVHGGSSGIGTTAIQLAHAMGAKVYTTAGSEEKCNACRELGAILAVNYREEDFVSACLEATDNKGIDLILDMIAGSYIERNIQLAAEDGRIVIIAGLGGFTAEVDFRTVMMKRLTLTGSTLRPRPLSFKTEIVKKLSTHVWPLLEAGKVRPVIHRVFPLADAADAHAMMEASSHIGKIVLSTSV